MYQKIKNGEKTDQFFVVKFEQPATDAYQNTISASTTSSSPLGSHFSTKWYSFFCSVLYLQCEDFSLAVFLVKQFYLNVTDVKYVLLCIFQIHMI